MHIYDLITSSVTAGVSIALGVEKGMGEPHTLQGG